MTPGSTTATSSKGETSRMRFSRSVETTSWLSWALAPPESPVPAPRGTTETPNRAAARTTAWTCSALAGKATTGPPGAGSAPAVFAVAASWR